MTPYGGSKVLAEQELAALADDDFSPVFLRNATAYGVSPRLRGDLVVNNLVGFAVTTGEVLMKSDGTPWRPLVHVEDIARAFLAVLEAPRDAVHDEAFNVGATAENYRIRDVAEIVEEVVPGSRVAFAAGAGAGPAQLPGQLRQDRARAAVVPAALDGPRRRSRALRGLHARVDDRRRARRRPAAAARTRASPCSRQACSTSGSAG